jgi:hypothetical protein
MSTDLSYSTNPADWTRYSHVSVAQQKPDGGVVGETINTVALIGKCVRSPGLKKVTSPANFISLFGGRDAGSGGALKGEVWKGLLNRQFSWPLVVSPVIASDAVKAASSPTGTTSAVAATGSITSPAKSAYTSGAIFTISDGTHTPTVFEIRKAGGAPSGDNVAVDLGTATSAQECAVLIAAAINGVTTTLTVTAGTPSGGVLALTADTSDATHNVPITTDIVATGFAISGMSGGVTYSASTAIARIDATSVGEWANGATGYGITYDVATASDAIGTHWDLVIHFGGKATRYANLNTSGSSDNLSSVVGSASTNLIALTKLAPGRPSNVTGASLASGSDGTADSGDYIDALDAAANYPGIDIVCVCERAVDGAGQILLNHEIARLAPLHPMTNFITWAGIYTAPGDESTADITTQANNIIWSSNTSKTRDAKAGDLVEGGSHLDMAAVLSQTAPDIDPGDEDNIPLLAGISELGNESLESGDIITLLDKGISILEKVDNGFRFHESVAVDGSRVVDVRGAQYLIQSLTNYWKHDLRKPFNEERARNMIAKGDAFISGLQHDGRIVDQDNATYGKAWKFSWVQTDEERAQNIGKLQAQIRLLPHLFFLVILTDISTGTSTFTLSKNL